MVLSAPIILQPRVQIPSTPATLFSIYIIEILMRKGLENKQKRGRDWPIFKKRMIKPQFCSAASK